MRTLLLNTAAAVSSIALASGIVAFADPANAASRIDTALHQRVELSDLDLRSDAGRATAARRIRQAATQVCDTGDEMTVAQCRVRAGDAAQKDLDALVAVR